MTEIDVETLREWLEAGRPVTVLDIRTPEDRAQWFVPGSIHVNAYAALKEDKPDALAGVDLPPDRPVVTICNAGKVSLVDIFSVDLRPQLERPDGPMVTVVMALPENAVPPEAAVRKSLLYRLLALTGRG